MIAISSANPIEHYSASFRSYSSSSTVRFHSRGDETPPCGQPQTLATCMVSPIRLDILQLLLIMETILVSKRRGTPCLSSAELIASIEVLSKAPSISIKAPKAISWVWSAISMALTTEFSAVSVALPDWQACWLMCKGFLPNTSSLIYLYTNLSKVFNRK
jgi:hypothetical protein